MNNYKIYTHFNEECDVYKANKPLNAIGIMIHSTGANNPNLKRYVNFPEVCGINEYKNWFGSENAYKGGDYTVPHFVIGKDKDGKIAAVQILPLDIRAQTAGSGTKGSANATHIQIEICEDGLTDVGYFNGCFKCCIELCTKLLTLNKSLSIPNIISHKEGHAHGIASGHGDPDHWLSRMGLSMDWLRREISLQYATRDEDEQPMIDTTPPIRYKVQVGAFSNRENAEKMLERVKAAGFAAFITTV